MCCTSKGFQFKKSIQEPIPTLLDKIFDLRCKNRCSKIVFASVQNIVSPTAQKIVFDIVQQKAKDLVRLYT